MVNHDNQVLEDSILKVFEEHEEQFFFPVTTQKDARAFIKTLHIKGVQYDKICEEIGEFEHNFSAWRKGLGRSGIGNRVIELINKPFQQLLLSDSEDSGDEKEQIGRYASSNKNRIQNVVQKSQSNGDTTIRPNVEERLPLHQSKEAEKEKQGELTSSWMKNIEKKTANITEEKNDNETISCSDSYDDKQQNKEAQPKAEIKEDYVTLETIKLRKVERKTEEPRVVMRENKEGSFERTLSFREKLQKARERESKTLSGSFTRESPPASPDVNNRTSEEKSESNDNEEQESQADIAKNEVVANESKLENESKIIGNEDKPSEELEKEYKGEDAEKEEETETHEASLKEGIDGKDDESEASTETCSINEEILVDENYDSDLDGDALGHTSEIANLLKQLADMKGKYSDGPGFIYVFSDNSIESEDMHRVKIGASRFPNKRLEQAKHFNTDIMLASAMSVNNRKKALEEITISLERCQLYGNSGWYKASLGKILETVSKIAARFPSESSDC